MKISKWLTMFALAVASSSVYGGAWGPGAFENDDALDWTWELESSRGSSVLVSAFERVVSSAGYIEAPDCSAAIAAAEVVAALRAKPHAQLPENVVA